MGYYLLTTYWNRFNPWMKSSTHFDYRTKRGFAGGQDLEWRSAGDADGGIYTYYASDQGAEDEYRGTTGTPPDPDRYRVHLRHRQDLDDRTYLMTEAQYLSDRDIFSGMSTGDGDQRTCPVVVSSALAPSAWRKDITSTRAAAPSVCLPGLLITGSFVCAARWLLFEAPRHQFNHFAGCDLHILRAPTISHRA